MKSTPLWTRWQQVWKKNPMGVALIEAATGSIWTRAQLQDEVLQLSQSVFRDASRRRVAFCWPNSPLWIASFLAVQKVGGSVLPLDASLPAEAQQAAALTAGADWLWSALGLLVPLRARRSTRKEVCLKLTSGSSGQPKRIACQAGHLLADGRHIMRGMGITAQDRNLALIPLGHSYGLGNLVIPFLTHGVPLVLASSFVPSQIPHWIKKYQVTVFPSVPEVLRALARLPGKNSLSPLRLVISAGATLPPETAQAFQARYGQPMHNFFGSSETGGICFDRTGESSLRGNALGSVLPGVTVQLAARGRIRVRSSAVAHPMGSFTLPDLGSWTDQGELSWQGRVRSVVTLGGKKIAPAEIEHHLRGLPEVTEAWVTVLHRQARSYLGALVETPLSEQAILMQLSATLPTWKMPRVLKTVQALPRTERGKLDTKELMKWLES